MSRNGVVTSVNAVDESGAMVGGRGFTNDTFFNLELSTRERLVMRDRFYWANQLIGDKIAAGGIWQGRMAGYLIKTDDGKTYLLGVKDLRPLTQQ